MITTSKNDCITAVASTLSPGQAAVTASAPLAATDLPRHQKSKREQGTNLPSFAYRRTENGLTAQLKQ